jgi:hypothetical protein
LPLEWGQLSLGSESIAAQITLAIADIANSSVAQRPADLCGISIEQRDQSMKTHFFVRNTLTLH